MARRVPREGPRVPPPLVRATLTKSSRSCPTAGLCEEGSPAHIEEDSFLGKARHGHGRGQNFTGNIFRKNISKICPTTD